MLCSLAAANSANWWIDIVNDRAGQVKQGLTRGVDPNALSPKGQPAIMLAIRSDAWDVYDVLAADSRTNVNEVNVHDETPLMYLAIVGQAKRAQALINRGAKVNRLGWTPLHYAASKGQVQMVKLLIANGAIINAPAPKGTTALMMAAYAGNEPIVRLLLQAGADVTTRNLDKHDAADWARLKEHNDLALKLSALADNVRTQRTAARAGDEQGRASVADGKGPPTGSGVKAVDLDRLAGPVPSKPSAESRKAPEKPDSTNSTSRYFDLDRFNDSEPVSP